MTTALIPPIEKKLLPTRLQQSLELAQEIGQGTKFFESFGHHIELYDWYISSFYDQLFHNSKIESSVKHLSRLRLSLIHGCQFCNKGNIAAALACGITQDQISHINSCEEGPFSEREKCAILLASVISLDPHKNEIDHTLKKRLQKAFSEKELLELGMIMGILTGIAKFMFTYDLVEKEPYCTF